MIDNGVGTDAHLSRVATWVLNTIGKALAVSLLVAFVCVAIAVAAGLPLFLYAAGLGGPLAFAAVLYNASAPTD